MDVFVLKHLRQHLLNAEALILRHRQVADVLAVDVLLPARDEVLEEVDGVDLLRPKVGLAVDSEEAVPADSVS